VVDGRFAFAGSANLTGAGIGCKGEHRRNFESGVVTTDVEMVSQIMEQFDSIWMGARCIKCQRKEFCPDYKHLIGE